MNSKRKFNSLQGTTNFDVDYSQVKQVVVLIAPVDSSEGISVTAFHIWKCAEATVGTSPAGTTTQGTMNDLQFISNFFFNKEN